MLKKGLYKEFLYEIVPLSCFAVLEYQESCQILPVLGNQGFDAVVLDESGREIDRIEMTCPGDGAENAKDARLVVDRGQRGLFEWAPLATTSVRFSLMCWTPAAAKP